MKISIITVCYNSSEFIRTAIESVFSQSYSNIEYIVIDGGSTDGTLDIIHEYGDRITCIVSEPDKGIYDAMNKGIALATGAIIGVLNSDDYYAHDTVIFDVAECFQLNTDVDMVLGNVDYVKATDLNTRVRHYSSFKFFPWQLRFGFMPAHPSAFIKKSAYNKVGEYKLGYKIAADFDVFVRMLLVHKLHYLKFNQTLVMMRLGGVSTSGFGSYTVTTQEILKSLKENVIYSNFLMVLMRLPVKLLNIIIFKLRT